MPITGVERRFNLPRKQQKLMRISYHTDISEDDTEYWGAFSEPFPAEESPSRRIIGVDWSNRGEVIVTWLIDYNL